MKNIYTLALSISLISLSLSNAYSQNIYSHIASFGGAGNTDGKFNNPFDVTVNSAGRIIVSDFNNNRVQMLSFDGINIGFVTKFGVMGTNPNIPNNYRYPMGVHAAADGYIYSSALYDQGVVRLLTATGSTLSHSHDLGWSGISQIYDVFKSPTRLFLSYQSSHRILTYTVAGFIGTTNFYNFQPSQVMGTFNTPSTANGQFDTPKGLFVDNDNKLYVVEAGNHRLQVFTFDGVNHSYYTKFGGTGSTNTNVGFSSPDGIYVNAQNRIFVSDRANHRVVILTQSGTNMGYVGQIGTGTAGTVPGTLNNPCGVSGDSQGRIYITDLSQRVHIYSPARPTITGFTVNNSGVCVGGSAAFQVSETNLGNGASYEWYFNNQRIVGATSNSYIVNSTSASNAGSYYVIVTDNISGGRTTSTSIQLSVNTAPVINAAATLSQCEGGPLTISTNTTPNIATTHKWYKAGVEIAGATAAGYNIASLSAANTGSYFVVQSNACGTSTSSGINVTVDNSLKPAILTQSSATQLCVGQPLTLNFTYSTGKPVTISWSKDNQIIPGASATSYSVIQIAANQAGVYKAQISNECGTASTSNIQVTVTTCTTSSIAEGKKGVLFYPNPSNGVLYFENIEPSEVKISDVVGNTVFYASSITDNKIEVNLSEGIYILTITSANGYKATRKLQITKN